MFALSIRGLLFKKPAKRKVVALGEEERVRENAFLSNLLFDWLLLVLVTGASGIVCRAHTSSRRECNNYQVPECRNGFESKEELLGLTKNVPNCEFEESKAHVNTA